MTDLIPAPRPVESPEDRMRHATADAPERSFAAYLTATERDQLDARAAAAEQERDDALDDLQAERAKVAELTAKLEDRRIRLRDADNDLLAVRGILSPNGYPQRVPVDLVPTVAPAVQWLADQVDALTAERDEALEARDVLRHRERVFTDAIRGIVEQLDRALAAWETQQQPQETGLGSPAARAQDARRIAPECSTSQPQIHAGCDGCDCRCHRQESR